MKKKGGVKISFSLKLGRFYNDEGILQHEEVLDLLNSMVDENEQLVTKCNSLKSQIDEMIDIFNNSGLDYHISDELEEILND